MFRIVNATDSFLLEHEKCSALEIITTFADELWCNDGGFRCRVSKRESGASPELYP